MIVKRGEKLGMDWSGTMAELQTQDWAAAIERVRDPAVQYPTYYTQPFHAYPEVGPVLLLPRCYRAAAALPPCCCGSSCKSTPAVGPKAPAGASCRQPEPWSCPLLNYGTACMHVASHRICLTHRAGCQQY